MEEELDYIVKYKMEEIKIKAKFPFKIMQYLTFVGCFIMLLFPIVMYILLRGTDMWWIYSETVMLFLVFMILRCQNCYLYFDKVDLIIKDQMVSYRIPIENLLNICIEEEQYVKVLKIQYISNNKVETIKITLEGYRVTFLYNKEELKEFMNFFKTKRECEKEEISSEYFTINRKYSHEEIQEMLTEGIKKHKRIEAIGAIIGMVMLMVFAILKIFLKI